MPQRAAMCEVVRLKPHRLCLVPCSFFVVLTGPSEMSVAWADRACREQDRIVTGSLRAGTQKLQWNKYGPERFGLLKYSQTITCQQVRWVFGLYQFSCIPLI